MASKKRDLLEVLKLELEFLKGGGYRKLSSWRPQFIFEDSPTCLNYGDPERKRPCSECVLMSLVPAEFREGKPPCHYIPLNERNDTIQSLQSVEHPGRTGGRRERVAHGHDSEAGSGANPTPARSGRHGEDRGPGLEELYGAAWRCPSNVQIRIARKFSTIVGDGYFVFTTIGRMLKHLEVAGCCVRHFWLCDGCSRTHVLEYHLGLGVVIRPRHGKLAGRRGIPDRLFLSEIPAKRVSRGVIVPAEGPVSRRQPGTNYNKDVSHGDEKFRRLLEAAPDAMVIVDRTGRILLVNSQTEKTFGYTREELLNQPVEILIPEKFRDGHPQHRGEYNSAPHPRPMGSGLELLGRRKDGTTFPVEISLSPLEEPDGVLVTAAIRDVTERKRAEEALRLSQERFRLLVEEVKDYAIFMLDPTGKILSWNEGARKIKGYAADEIIGQHFSRFYTSEDIEHGKPNEELRFAAAEGRWEEEGWRLRKDGSRFWADVVITALHDKDGSLLGFTKVTRDITEGKRAREAFLLEVTNALVSNLDIRQLLSAIASCVRQVKPFDYATLALYDAPTKMLRMHVLEASAGAEVRSFQGKSLLVALGKSPAGWAYTTRKPLLLKGQADEKWPFEMPPQFAHRSLKSGCWIPLIGR